MAQKRISRHRFLKNITVTCTCSGLFAHPISARYAVEKTGKSDASAGKTNMEYRRLGRTGLKVSALNDVETGKTLLADILRKIKQTTTKQK